VNTAVEGYYAVNYAVTDSDGNTATATTIVFVGKDWVFGPNYAIRAYDFSQSVGNVLGTDIEMVSSARAQAIGTNPAAADFGKQAAVSVANNGGYPAKKVGNYDITFAVQAEVGTAKTIKATVTGGSAPVLTVPDVRIVPASGGGFIYMQGVTANDAEDGDITSKVIHNTPENMNSAGAYKVTYGVTDSDGNTAQKSGIVLVGTGWVVKGGYALYAEDFARKLSAIAGTSDEATRLAKAMAVWIADSSSGEFGKYVPTKIAELGGYKKAKGNYDITFAVAEKTSVTKTIRAAISDDTPKAPNVVINQPNPPAPPAPSAPSNPPAPPAPPLPPNVVADPSRNITVNPSAPLSANADANGDGIAEEPAVSTVAGITASAMTVPEMSISDSAVPTNQAPRHWSLLDLLFAIAAFILGFYLMIIAMRRKDDEDDEQSVDRGKQIRRWGMLGISLGIASIIILLLTQHFGGNMQIADFWTLPFAAILGIELCAILEVNKKEQDEWDDERDI
jgi:hypothetical protein